MRIKTINKYIAFDDTEFDTKEECEEYEKIINIKDNKDITILDRCFKDLKHQNIDANEIISTSFHIRLKTDESVKIFKKASSFYGHRDFGINSKGDFVYSYTDGMWIKIDEMIEKYTKMKEKLNDMTEKKNVN